MPTRMVSDTQPCLFFLCHFMPTSLSGNMCFEAMVALSIKIVTGQLERLTKWVAMCNINGRLLGGGINTI